MRKLLALFIVCLVSHNLYAQPINRGRLEFTESDSSPSVFPYQIKVTNSTLTDNGDGTVTLNTGGSNQTPWTSDINGGSYNLTNVSSLAVSGNGTNELGNTNITGTLFVDGQLTFPNQDATPSTVGGLLYDGFVPNVDDGMMAWWDSDEQKYLVDLVSPPTTAQDDYAVSWDNDIKKFYMRSIAGGSESTTVADTTTIDLTLTGTEITADGKYTAGDHLTLTGADFDVDDDFLHNSGGDTGTGTYILDEVSSPTVTTKSISPTQVVFSNSTNSLVSDADLRFDTGTNTLYSTYFNGDGSAITNIGQDSATALTFSAKAGEALYKGQAVYISSATGNNVIIKKADNTNTTTSRVVGIVTTNLALNGQGSVRRAGVLTQVDTRSSNTNVNPLGQTWAAGDLLFATTGGGLTNVRPTSGRSVKAAYSLQGSGATDSLLAYPMENPVWSTAASGETVVLRMGDDYGNTKVSFRNYSNTEKASFDSNGNLTISEGKLADSVIVSADIKDGTITAADTKITAGRSLTWSTDDIAADAEVYTHSVSFNIENVTTADDGWQYQFANAVTLVNVSCSCDSGNATIQFDERAVATPNTGGTDVLTSALVCDNDTQSTTDFANAGIAAGVPFNLDVDAVSGTPKRLRIHVKYTDDD